MERQRDGETEREREREGGREGGRQNGTDLCGLRIFFGKGLSRYVMIETFI